jgi:DNA topoisomerase-2
LDTNKSEISYQDFIGKEMIHFSKYDCDRSIPNLMDGLKTSQRKILYTAFKRKLVNEIKVAQFSGSVSEISCYHHGESSLNGAIVNMAQNYVGSNNINLLEPKGQFGTRLQGGEDSASERYIHTNLNKLTRFIFPEQDDGVLNYLDDDGTPVEPIYYAPIIPMVLVNGSKGIGTGFSTDIMCYKPLDVIEYVSDNLSLDGKKEKPQINPYYEGFKGTIRPLSTDKWLFKGCYDIISEKEVHITELPIGTWTDDYKKYIEDLIDGGEKNKKSKGIIKDYNDMSTDVNVDITITFVPHTIEELVIKETEYACNALEKLLKLYTTKTTTNMHMFDEDEKLKKFDNASEIVEHFMSVRMNIYVKRKENQVSVLEKETLILTNKARFIGDILNDKLDLRRKKRDVVTSILSQEGYDIIDDDKDYKYLVRLPMDSVTQENVDKLMNEKKDKISELEILKGTPVSTIWKQELALLREEYLKYLNIRNNSTDVPNKKKIKVKKVVKKSY